MSLNKIVIIGNVGRDPELRYTGQGKKVCDISIATNEKWKDATTGEVKEETTWFRVTFWERQAEIASEYLRKGREVYVEGRLRMNEWMDNEGKTRVNLEVVGSELKLIGNNQGSSSTSRQQAGKAGRVEIKDDEVPF